LPVLAGVYNTHENFIIVHLPLGDVNPVRIYVPAFDFRMGLAASKRSTEIIRGDIFLHADQRLRGGALVKHGFSPCPSCMGDILRDA
jgi:hypothetical protein